MSLEDYAKYITQKYTLAAAIAVIKTKPDDMTMQAHIDALKFNLKDSNMDSDLNITVCSEDFDISNDIDNITLNNKDFEEVTENTNENLDLNDSITILRDFQDTVFRSEGNRDHDTSKGVTNILNALIDVDGIGETTENLVDKQKLCEDMDLTQVNDNEETIYQNKTPVSNDNLHKLKSKIEINHNPRLDMAINDPSMSYNTSTKVLDQINQTKRDFRTKLHANISKNIDKEFRAFTKIASEQISKENTNHITLDNKAEVLNKEQANITPLVHEKEVIRNVLDNSKPIDSQETICTQSLTESYSHVSQSQAHMVIPESYIHGVKRNMNIFKDNTPNCESERMECENMVDVDMRDHNLGFSQWIQNNQHIDATDEANSFQINQPHMVNRDDILIHSNKTRDFDANSNTATIHSLNDKTERLNEINEEEDVVNELTTSQTELIPFKVIEELNKIKSFLRRFDRRINCDGFSSDSGYRSDSQSRNRSALQLSGPSSNQSGQCLLDFISHCALVHRTLDIYNEASLVLGQLIDRLHEEEKYPSFLEELLEQIDVLLKRIYEEESDSENLLITKDEQVQRILLLNQSVHIQKFTIDKITDILQDIHAETLRNDDNFEIENINKIENVAYIFHALEILIKRFLKSKDLLSQTSNLSQQDVLKRSSITDIWRKKWNPNYKESQTEGSFEKCVLTKCSEILNKLIVNSIDHFSLFAYASLQCFNCMQN